MNVLNTSAPAPLQANILSKRKKMNLSMMNNHVEKLIIFRRKILKYELSKVFNNEMWILLTVTFRLQAWKYV